MADDDRETLFEVDLVPDPDQLHELGPADDNDVLRDDEVKGCRIVVVRRKVLPRQFPHGAHGALELECQLFPARGLRFTYAHVTVVLDEPKGESFFDIAPTTIAEPCQVAYAYEAGGKIIEIPIIGDIGQINAKYQRTVIYRHHTVRGAGAGTGRVEWTAQENPHTKSGLDTVISIFMSTRVTGRLTGRFGLSASVERNGAKGGRRLLFGKEIKEEWRQFAVEVPLS